MNSPARIPFDRARELRRAARDFAFRVHLVPSGEHLLEVALLGTGTSVTYRQADLFELRAAFEAFEAECAFEDGRPNERLHPLVKGIEP
ncbi:MAG: hypothetical protein H6873_05545 [Hyphomicrobiaceae bacterium]|nr:hypothetical protein [Hyphomicrobiaceae bacterium]